MEKKVKKHVKARGAGAYISFALQPFVEYKQVLQNPRIKLCFSRGPHTSLYLARLVGMVSLKLQKRLAASVLKCGTRKIWMDPNEVRAKR